MFDIAEKLASGKAAKFVSLVYRNNQKELAKHVIVVNFLTENMYRSDLETLELMRPGLTGIDAQAADELIASLNDSLENGIGNNTLYTQVDTYEPIPGLRGVRLHKENQYLYINGIAVDKTVIEVGEPRKPVKSAPLTIAKNALRRQLKTGKFRMFKLDLTNKMYRVAVNGDTIEIIED